MHSNTPTRPACPDMRQHVGARPACSNMYSNRPARPCAADRGRRVPVSAGGHAPRLPERQHAPARRLLRLRAPARRAAALPDRGAHHQHGDEGRRLRRRKLRLGRRGARRRGACRARRRLAQVRRWLAEYCAVASIRGGRRARRRLELSAVSRKGRRLRRRKLRLRRRGARRRGACRARRRLTQAPRWLAEHCAVASSRGGRRARRRLELSAVSREGRRLRRRKLRLRGRGARC